MYKLIIVLAILLIWGGCANKVPPSGGPKDEIPPKLIASIPKNGNTDVRTSEFTLLFDELVITKNIKKELLITPRIDFDYEYKIKKNTVIITLEEPLDSATTYTFNFRNSIVDITENNPVEKLILAFSTGSILDTLQLQGNVNDLFTEKPVENLVVGLYKSGDSLNLFNSPPYYLAQTDEKGNYLFRNIKPNEYILNAFEDNNNNLICESSREAYAFTNTTIKLDSNLVADTLKLQSLNIDTLELKRTRNSGQYFMAIANKYLTGVSLKASNDSTIWYSLDKEHKDIKIYNTFTIKDSLYVELEMRDSINSVVKDTLYVKFPKSERKYETYELKVQALELFPDLKKISFKVNTNKPTKFVYKDSIRIRMDTLGYISFDSTWNVVINPTHTFFEFSNQLPKTYLDSITNSTEKTTDISSLGSPKPEEKYILATLKKRSVNIDYELEIPFGSFQSIESDSSQQQRDKLTPKYAKDFGILMGDINTTYTHYTVQLLSKDYTVIKEIGPSKKYKIRNIPPGDYLIRIMIDLNKNGVWDAGNILLNHLPEPVILYKNEDGNSKSTIRANWEITLNLNF